VRSPRSGRRLAAVGGREAGDGRGASGANETLRAAAERITLAATRVRREAHAVVERAQREALLLAADELMASARRLRVIAAQAAEADALRGEGPIRELADPVAVGPITLDPRSREVRVDGDAVVLPAKEYGLLRVLISDPTRVFTKAELLRAVWGLEDGCGVRTRTLDSHASRLRRRLSGASHRRFVANVWGVGYRLVDELPAEAVAA
jgi:DNA-binding winged helix-turn-helix (wHTH) protein